MFDLKPSCFLEQVAILAHSGSSERPVGSGPQVCQEAPTQLSELRLVEVQVHVTVTKPALASAQKVNTKEWEKAWKMHNELKLDSAYIVYWINE